MTLKEVSLENRPQDARGCLDAILAARRESAAAQVRELQMVTEFADCYSWVDDPRLVVSTHGETLRQVASDGTPGVAEFAVLELSTRLGVSRESAMSLLCDALNLRHRLPGIWRLMDAGKLPVWQARRFAVVTSGLTLAQALAVDARLAASAVGMTFGRLLRFAEGLVVEADPVAAQERHDRKLGWRDVRVGDSVDGLAPIDGLLGGADARFLDATLTRVAGILATGGDTDDLGARRSKALGVLASPARALQLLQADLLDELPDDVDACPAAGQRGHTCGTITVDPERLLPTAHIVVHLTDTTACGGVGVARSDALGPVLAGWLKDLLASTRVTVRPVLDQGGILPSDSYEVPDLMREAVLLRSPTEVFPFSARAAHGRGIDVDHTIPFVHGHRPGKNCRNTGVGAPPGQTRPDNLGPLGRPAHRAKTHGRWNVAQVTSGFFLWTSPLGYHYLVTPSRTYALDEPPAPTATSPGESAAERAFRQLLDRRHQSRPVVLLDFLPTRG